MFADDLKLYIKINSIHDFICLNYHLNATVQWNWIFHLISRNAYLFFYHSRSSVVFDYNINTHKLIRVGNTIKDLGIVFDTKLKLFSSYRTFQLSTTKNVLRVCTQYKSITLVKLLYYGYQYTITQPWFDMYLKTDLYCEMQMNQSKFYLETRTA